MYSREFFLKQFQSLDTEVLIEKLATQELADEARDAVTLMLGERGVSGEALDKLVHTSKKDQYLKTGVTNQCDFCGRGLFVFPVTVDGQRFCGIDCFHTSRLRRAAVDITDDQALDHAKALKSGSCPACAKKHGGPDMHKSHFIASMIFVVTTSTESSLKCRSCATRGNLWAIAYCATLGWWSLKGIFVTPAQIFSNVWEILSRKESPVPSSDLVDWARLMLAEQQLQSAGEGKWALRA